MILGRNFGTSCLTLRCLHIYNDPENCNPVTDAADFTIPETGTFPPVHEYRIK
jgi:hypothetical protein